MPVSAPAVRMISVYRKGHSLKATPYFSISDDAARDMVNMGQAKWVNKARGIQLLTEEAEAKLRDISSTMSHRVTELALMGSQHHQALVNAWRPTLRFV